ncbi:MAG: haloacid dehalogenase [Zetaproteobacteria bacterium CG1_02_53_45]|nr:MAG: haloacid dehalogenase [Zetaproteobacteria bacterium CG1_02_53_45]
MSRILLCTDLDRTLIPNGEAPESAGARVLFRRLAGRAEVRLVYVSGRDQSLIEQAISEFDLPVPDDVIADVGATIYDTNKSEWGRLQAWDEEIAPDWKNLQPADLQAGLSDLNALHLQEPEKQGLFKLSYYTPVTWNTPAARAAVEMRLQALGVKANLIWSIDDDRGVGLLDILPASANKRHAIEFLAARYGFARCEMLFAGDSGNDLDVLASPIPSVLVANASDEVRRDALALDGDLYLAQGGYLGMNGNYSAGILEGLAHYHPRYDRWLREQL